mmetsp:Transcript_28026/g.74010  ORF Transcript_28026/g.74010 Transcript_28026/m.74010 type:complete len:208 (+) Transcript_28026:914-1537(+)
MRHVHAVKPTVIRHVVVAGLNSFEKVAQLDSFEWNAVVLDAEKVHARSVAPCPVQFKRVQIPGIHHIHRQSCLGDHRPLRGQDLPAWPPALRTVRKGCCDLSTGGCPLPSVEHGSVPFSKASACLVVGVGLRCHKLAEHSEFLDDTIQEFSFSQLDGIHVITIGPFCGAITLPHGLCHGGHRIKNLCSSSFHLCQETVQRTKHDSRD